jgi:site-specific DNA-cytosine methylase
MIVREILHGHLFCGLGAGAKGFNKGTARVGNLQAKFRCIGGIDNNAAAVRDFGRLTGTPGTMLDLFTREQYIAFNGRMPPADWVEATPADILRAMGYERPNIWFLSAPCKGFSGLLSESRSMSEKYQALNQLALRGLMLALEAYKDDPVEFFLFENVPRIATRGRHLLDQIIGLLSAYGYAVAETTHDCGELGNLAQSRKRFLLVARHTEKVPPFLYEPVKRPLRPVGDVLGKMLLPGDPAAGPMHRIPALHWKTWVRLAFVEAGSDWRSLQKLAVEDGFLRDFAIAPDAAYHQGVYGVQPWDEPTGTVTSRSGPSNGNYAVADPRSARDVFSGHGVTAWADPAGTVAGESFPSNGKFAVADPRIDGHPKSVQMGVRNWDEPAAVMKGDISVGTGPYAVADPRMQGVRMNNVFRIVRWDEVSPAMTGGGHPTAGGLAVSDPRTGYGPNSHRNKLAVVDWERNAGTVTGSDRVGSGALSVADPRAKTGHGSKYAVTPFDAASRTVIAASTTGEGAFAVADPRPRNCPPLNHEGRNYQTGGAYGVVPWSSPAGVVSANGQHDNSPVSVADPRLPGPSDRLVCVIVSRDGTWHRPFTTLDMACLQSLVDPEEKLELDGLSDSAWRERIGNAVPPDAAEAIAGAIGTTLLLAWSGETFSLGSTPIWVRDVAVALSVAQKVPS